MIDLGKDVVIEDDVVINVKSGYIGDRSIIRSGARIEGHYVYLGTESYLDHGAWIGGGSCFDELAYLKSAEWLHMGWNSQINIARGVDIGSEVGLGIETKIFTHGAYLPIDQGFPVQWDKVIIGDRVWIPHGWVNPGVKIGSNIVVGAMSLVNRDLPDGCLAAGIPVKILKENYFPKEVLFNIDLIMNITNISYKFIDNNKLIIKDTEFLIKERIINGPATGDTEKVKNQLRRNGIRFKYAVKKGAYVLWNEF